MTSTLPRRAFLAGAGASLLAAPAVVRGQNDTRKRLAIFDPSLPQIEIRESGHPLYQSFFSELRRLGWIEGETITVERWTGENKPDTYSLVADMIAASRPDVVYATGAAAYVPMSRATRSIPIVFTGADPLPYGVVASLAHPGGNLTGFSNNAGPDMAGKRLDLLCQAVPAAKKIALLATRAGWEGPDGQVTKRASEILQVDLVPVILDEPVDAESFRRAIVRIQEIGADALIVGSSSETSTRLAFIGSLALQAKLPAIATIRDFTAGGGLLSYTNDRTEPRRGAAGYIDRILRGETPANLPIQQPMVFDLVINKRTATALGLEIPLGLYVQATEIIE